MNGHFVKCYLCLLISLSFFSCSSDEKTQDRKRPHDPWVFRTVLDGKARIATIALNDHLWVAYDTERASLLQAWKGSVLFEGAVYNTIHGPQPLSMGDKYMENPFPNPWLIRDSQGNILEPTIQYRGHRFDEESVTLQYELTHPSIPGTIRVFESPESHISANNRPVFIRSFRVEGLNDPHQLRLKTHFYSILVKNDIQTNSTLEYTREDEVQLGKINTLDLDAEFILHNDKPTTLTITFLEKPLIPNPNSPEVEMEEEDGIHEGLRLIARSDCKTCHNRNLKTIGPSYVQIAEKYEYTPENVAYLAGKIKTGGSGIWGSQVMTPHSDLSNATLQKMSEYILSLGEGQLKESVEEKPVLSFMPAQPEDRHLIPGLLVDIYDQRRTIQTFTDVSYRGTPRFAGILPNLANLSGGDFVDLDDFFALRARGFLKVDREGEYAFRIWSDDGSRVFLNDTLILDNDGMHGTAFKEVSIRLVKGYYPVQVEYFQGGGGKFLSFNWRKAGASQFEVISKENFFYNLNEAKAYSGYLLPMASNLNIPGNGSALASVHPSFDLYQARPFNFTPKVGGMDFNSKGQLVISTWDAEGAVYLLDNPNSTDPSAITVKKIASGLAEPLGLKVVDDTLYVLQKQELTKLIDHNGDGVIDEYYTLSNQWMVSNNFHEFSFGLAYRDGYFYGALATAIDPGGASTQPQITDRGKVIKIAKKDGSVSFIASGLRTPNGIGIGYNDELYVTDNQGDWLPSSKVLHVREGDWFGSRSVEYDPKNPPMEKLPVVWLPQDEIGNSPSTPSWLNLGPYQNQMIHGEVTHGGVKRVFVEEVEGQFQGAVFRFTQGLEAGINRLVWSPDGDLYVGGIGSSGNWGHSGKLHFGLQRLKYNGKNTFEMLAVKARSNGIEIELTEPLKYGEGWQKSDYFIQQWYYKPTEEYGGPKLDLKTLNISSVHVSEDRKKIFLELPGMKPNHVIYVRLLYPFVSEKENELWSTEAWYTLNKIPSNQPGFRAIAPVLSHANTLSEHEIAHGWKLLFDGKTTEGWRNYRKPDIGSSWKVRDGMLYLDAIKRAGGGWQAPDGGDIITDKPYENYELSLEWKISQCGNSGIIFHVTESEEYNYVWQTGPEMQILDNSCHPDTRYQTHRAGDLYDMIETRYLTVRPSGEWNHVRIISNQGKVQFWLNGYRVVDFDMTSEEWKQMIARSKFKDMTGFGQSVKGHIALQDHGDPVFFRNIKIREL
ncbi:MAG TPA: DUF1080 domain-containing protein [Saprospiraceae bacterium]|nr:DUF1080 domain-containing protein [Saprospiraceae bacterium]